MQGALVAFGKGHFLEARPEIEKFLSSDDPEMRKTALLVLVFGFGLYDYLDTARQFLEHDPDVHVRMIGASALGTIMRNTSNEHTLALLASVVRNDKEDTFVRRTAYAEMRSVLQDNPREHFTLATSRLHFPEDVD